MNQLRRRLRPSADKRRASFLSPEKSFNRRVLTAERLEDRTVMAADGLYSEYWNGSNPLDVNRDSKVSAIDALIIINELNTGGARQLPQTMVARAGAEGEASSSPRYYIDVNNDGYVSAVDALNVINNLNAEGEDTTLVHYTIQAVAPGTDTPISSINVGEEFDLRVLVQDTRPVFMAEGVFGGYLDIVHDDSKVDVSVNEIQHLVFDNFAVGGQFSLSFDMGGTTFTTAPLTFVGNTTNQAPLAAQIQAALEALPNIGAGNVRVAHDRLPGDVNTALTWRWQIKFQGDLADVDVPQITVNNLSLVDSGNNPVAAQVFVTANGTESDPNAVRFAFQSPNVFDRTLFSYGSVISAGLAPGRFDDVGAQSKSIGSGPGSEPIELVRARLKAVDGGLLNFTGDVVNLIRPAHDTTLYGSEVPVLASQITVTNASIQIIEPISAVLDSATVAEDGSVLINVLGNDTTVAGAVALSSVGAPANGTAVIEGNQIRYTPAANFAGSDSFHYTITDGLGHFDIGTVNITVTPVNDAPTIALPAAPTVNEDAILTLAGAAAIQVADVESVNSNVVVTLQATNGILTLSSTQGLVVSGNGTSSITLTGVIGAVGQTGTINNALNGMTYKPNVNFNGPATINVTVNDQDPSGPLTTPANLTVNVAPLNDAPVNVVPGAQMTIEEEELIFSTATSNAITVSDIDATGSSILQVSLSVAHGTLTLGSTSGITFQGGTQNGENSLIIRGTVANLNAALNGLTYVSDMGFFGDTDHLTVVTDDLGVTGAPGALTASSTIDIDVDSGTLPRARRDVFSGDEDTSIVIPVTALFINDTASDEVLNSPTLTFLGIGTPPSHGTVVVDDKGTADTRDDEITYTPDSDYNGQDSFTYIINDTAGTGPDATATVQINLAPVQDVPVANDDTYVVDEDTPLIVSAVNLGVIGNDNDPDVPPQELTAQLVTDATHGALSLNADGTFTYTPAANFNGTDTFSYKLTDGFDDSNTATVTITVNAVNDAPVANGDSYSTAEDTALTIALPGVLGNDTDTENDPLTAAIVSQPAHGSVTLNVDGSFTYTPAGDYNGPDSFTYKANDGALDSAPATVQLTVTAVNDAPVAANDTFSVAEDTTLAVNALNGVLRNDSDIDSAQIGAVLVSNVSHGSLTLNNDGSFTYTPAANYFGPDSFTYRATDGLSNSLTATVTINVTAVNDAPVAGNDSFTTAEDSPLNIPAPGLLGNDTDADPADTLTAVIASQPSHGVVAINPDGSFTYTPAANYFGPDSFTYRANDGAANSNVATVSLTVTAVNDNPIANNDGPITVIKDFNNQQLNVLANDNSGPDPGETLTINGTSGTTAQGGTVTIGGSGTFILYNAPAGYEGPDSFTYTISDGNGGTATATVSLDVVNFIPTDITGYVYLDNSTSAQPNGNGQFEAGERGLAGVSVTISSPTGKDMFGVNFNPITVTTDATGKYSFPQIRPGNYVISESQPVNVRDGVETAGGTFATVNANQNDKIFISLPQLGLAAGAHNNNFAELGIDAATLTDSRGLVQEMLSSSSNLGIVVSSGANGDTFWYWALSGWNNVTDIKVVLSSNLATATLSAKVNGTLHTTTISQSPNSAGARFRVLGENIQGGHIIRLDGTAEGFFGIAATQGGEGEGEGYVDQAYRDSVDAVMNESSWA